MKNFKFLICCINVHLLHGESVAADDILAMLQSSLRVKAEGQNTQLSNDKDMGVPDMKSISRLEEIVMARVREGLGGDNKLTATINASVKQMFSAIMVTTKANQAKINLDIKAFLACKTGMWKNYFKAIPMEKDFDILGKIYPKCSIAVSKLQVKSLASDKIYKTQSSNLNTKKQLLKYEEDKCTNTCANQHLENYQEQLDKLEKYYQTCKDDIKPKIDDVIKEMNRYKNISLTKNFDNAKYLAMKQKCDLIAYRMNKKKCEATGTLTSSCSVYSKCWKTAKKVYESDKTRITPEEANMKLQWRALTRLQCYLLVLNTANDKDKKKEKAQLDKCIAVKTDQISVKHLKIDYKKEPPKPVCPKDPWCPCTTAYTNQYYKNTKFRCVKNKVKKYICAACPKGKQ